MLRRFKVIILLFLFLFILESFDYVFAEESGQFRFIVMGCAHFTTFTTEDYESLNQSIKKYDPDFILFFSDVVDSPEEKSMLTLGKDFHHQINKLMGIPVFDFLNNRQLAGLLSIPGDKVALKENQYLFEYKNNLFIYPAVEDSIAESQLNLLNNIVGDISKYNNIFIFTRGYSWFDEEREWAKIIPFLWESNVRYIFGPNMQYFDLKKIDNTYIMSKFMPCYLKRCPESSFNHFLVVDVDNHSTSIKFTPFSVLISIDKKILSEEQISGKFHTFRERERKGSLLKLELIIDALKIKPGMEILDIGAGEGLFTLLFAEALKGTGRVFATEVKQEWLEAIRKRAEENRLNNVFPVLVQSEGVDAFYNQHSFDIIFLCETHTCLQNREDYFRELKPSLKKEGRLYIINRDHTLSTDDFTGHEFGDFKEVIQVLISKGKDFAVFRRLEKEVQDFIENWQGENVPIEMRTKITQNFNKIISDRWFFKDLVDSYAREDMTVEESGRLQPTQFSALAPSLKQYKWFIVGLDSLGVFEPTEKELANSLEEPLRMFNKRLLTSIFDSARQLMLLKSKDNIISIMESTGYELVGEYDFNKDYYFLEFKSKP